MITTPTVFVLGAGASVDFQFPTGWGLLRKVVEEFRVDTQSRLILKNCMPISDEAMNSFVKALDQSGENSVDTFLEKREQFIDLGKAMMAVILIRLEHEINLFSGSAQTNWMRYLLSKMQGKTLDDFAKNEVAFITFNYDRSLEHFLCTTLSHSFGKTEEECGAIIVDRIPIVHLHGQLGFLPWQKSKTSRPYGDAIDSRVLDMCVREVKIVHEGIENRKAQFDQAKNFLHKADRIYFLGVGFNNVNLDRLNVMGLQENKAWSTAFGLTDQEYRVASQKYGLRLALKQHFDCNQLVNNFVRWD
jgi:hypothetical protein